MTIRGESVIFPLMTQQPADQTHTLQEQLSQTREELAILYDISSAMRTTLELNQILYIILTGVTAHTGLGFNRAILFLVNKKDRTLDGKMAIAPESGEDAAKIWRHIENENQDFEDLISAYKSSQDKTVTLAHQIQRLKIPLNSAEGGLLAQVYANGSPLHVYKNDITRYNNDPFLQVFKTDELIVMPLKAKDRVNGIIVADNLFTRRPINPDDLKLFTMLANQAGLAIENSQLYEMVVHKSHTDSLTALWNHGFFQDTLIKEMDKSKNSQAPLSLALLDIDDFKKFNDTWGHQNGDVVLTALAKILKNYSREIDYVCRYGGEEFAIILTQTNKEQAFLIAERLRDQISHQHFQLTTSQQIVRLTVSIGIAAFPADAISKEELILKADKAMYTAKFIGKNKTCLSE